MPITRTPIINDDGSGTVGTVWENAWKVELYNQIDAALLATQGAAVGGVVGNRYLALANQDYGEIAINDLRPYEVIYLYNFTQPITIHSISTNGAIRAGQIVAFIGNPGVPAVRFAHNSSVQANTALRFSNIVTSAPTPITSGGVALYQHNGTAWMLLHHEQGAWIVPPYSAAYFGAQGGGTTWTVDAADVTTLAYRLTQKTLNLTFYFSATTVGGSPGALILYNTAFGGFSIARQTINPIVVVGAGVNEAGFVLTQSGVSNYLTINRITGTFSPSTNGVYAYGTVILEMT